MWVFTIDGFYSVVQHRIRADWLMVRARDRDDLQRLSDRMQPLPNPIQHTPDGDYAYRMTLTRKQWDQYMALAAGAIDYENFKDAVATTLGHERANLYLRVWATMNQLQHG